MTLTFEKMLWQGSMGVAISVTNRTTEPFIAMLMAYAFSSPAASDRLYTSFRYGNAC